MIEILSYLFAVVFVLIIMFIFVIFLMWIVMGLKEIGKGWKREGKGAIIKEIGLYIMGMIGIVLFMWWFVEEGYLMIK